MKYTARVLVTAGFAAALVGFVWVQRDELRPVWENPSWNLLFIALLISISHFLNSLEFWVVYRALRIKISIIENWMVFTSGLLGNLLPGQLGTVYKFRYMRTVHQIPHSKNGSSYAANLVISLGSSAVVGVLGVFVHFFVTQKFAVWVFAAFTSFGLLCLGLIRSAIPVHRSLPGKLKQAVGTFASGWDDIRRQPKVAIIVGLIDVAKYFVTALRFYLAFQLVNIEQSFWFFLVLAPAAALAGIIAITPAGLGFRELFVTLVAVGMGTGFNVGLLASTLDRGLMIIAALVLGSIGYFYTFPRMRRAGLVDSPD